MRGRACKAWKAVLQDGSYTMIRLYGKNVSFKECLDILDYRGYVHTDIQNLEEVWEEA